jgi:membrane protein YqaA with SNARE-associated domain
MIKRLYDRILALAERPDALWALAAVSFAEAWVFPITPLVMVIPMVLAAPHRAWLIAGVCTAASVAGALFGYAIGALLFEQVGLPLLSFYGKADDFAVAAQWFRDNGFGAVFFAAFTPFPFKVITIGAGVAELSLVTLVLASIVGRGLQFFLVAAILWKLGEPARLFIDRYFAVLATGGALLIVGGFVAVKYLV